MQRFNPLNAVASPALLGVVAGAAALSDGHDLWALGLVPGVLFIVLGVRIAYDARLAPGAERIRDATPWNAWTPVWYFRQLSGAVIAVFGLFFIGVGAEGIANLVS